MNDVLAPAEDTLQRASVLNALGILSRLEGASPDRTGERKRWIAALVQLARPDGASTDDCVDDPEVLREVLTFLEALEGSSVDPALASGAMEEATEPTAEVPERMEEAQQPSSEENAAPDFEEVEAPDFEEVEAPGFEEVPSQEVPPESSWEEREATLRLDGYTQEEIDYVRTLQQQVHERAIARMQTAAQYPQPLPSAPLLGQEGQSAPAPVPWMEGDVRQPAPMAPFVQENTPQQVFSVERVESGPAPSSARRPDLYRQGDQESAPEERTGRGRHARIEQRQWQLLFSTFARSLVLVGGLAFAALAYASHTALLPILGVVIVVGGALTHAWTTMLHTQGDGPKGHQRGERVSWLRALRMCTLAVPILTLVIGSVILTLIGSTLLPKQRAEFVNEYAREALRIAQRLALHR